MSSSTDPPAKNTRSAHARRTEKSKPALPSEEQPPKKPERVAVQAEAPARSELTQLTPIAEDPQINISPSAEGSFPHIPEKSEGPQIREIPDDPQIETEQSFATAHASFTPLSAAMSTYAYYGEPEERLPTPEPRRDKGKQRADYGPSQRASGSAQSNQSESPRARTNRELRELGQEVLRWGNHLRKATFELEARMEEQDDLQRRFRSAREQYDLSKQMFQETQQSLDRFVLATDSEESHPISP
jgi:hypothetical protein